ncbi:hypothetical protein R3P38DRAFT_3565632 [Favolaschia claudopus]|uniref:G-protein coupled receptors family 2 profile 2 domain-containing protein n=1 Tax=Favolaschia claudopus TaxID=2862362 RepID=A0AAW0DX48_9AGAR
MTISLESRTSTPAGRMSKQIILGLIIPGMALTTVLLILSAYATWNPKSRRYLDRVSFRLLVYALVAHIVFGVVFTVGALTAYPGWQCNFLSFMTNLSLMFSASMFFCVALNLPLVLGQHVTGKKMEKFYILGSATICLIANIIPYATGNLGWDAQNRTCWYRSGNPGDNSRMIHWLLATQSIWLLLFSMGEVFAFLAIVGYLVAYELDQRRFHSHATRQSMKSGGDGGTQQRHAGSTVLMLNNIVIRVALYPLISCLLNISTTVLDLYEMKHPHHSKTNWRLNLMGKYLPLPLTHLAIYSGRPLIYGLLAATDPSFVRALNALCHPEGESTGSDQSGVVPGSPTARGLGTGSACLSTVIELSVDEGSGFGGSREASAVHEGSVYAHKGGRESAMKEVTTATTSVSRPQGAARVAQQWENDLVCHL